VLDGVGVGLSGGGQRADTDVGGHEEGRVEAEAWGSVS
jgi:hypothetical protein